MPIFKIIYFRTVVCILIILAITFFKFVFHDQYSGFKNYYETEFLDELDIGQIIKEKETKETDTRQTETVSEKKETDTVLSELSGNSIAFDLCIPVKYQRISSDYGYRYNPVTGNYALHSGIDFAASEGEKIVAVEDGTVNKAKYSTDLGYFVQINHGNGLFSTYAHCLELKVKADEKVKKGDIIALVGSTGQSTGPHLHFEVKLDSTILNPTYYLPIEKNA